MIFLLLFFIGSSVYFHALNAGFQFDDQHKIIQNISIHNPSDIGTVWRHNPRRIVANWTFALNYSLSGSQPFGYHVLSLFFHVICAFFVYLLLKVTLRTSSFRAHELFTYSEAFALFGALIFLVHPIQTQAAAYVVQRSTILASLFYLAAIFFLAQFRLSGKYSHYLFALTAAFASTFSKETAFTLPIAVFLYQVCFFGHRKHELKKNIYYALPFFLPLIVLFFAYYQGRVSSKGLESLTSVQTSMSHKDYLLTEFSVIRTYLRLLLCPIHQNLDYDYPIAKSFFGPVTLASFLLLCSLLLVSIKTFAKNKLLSFGILFFFLALSIESSFIVIFDVINEHRLYLPIAGFIISFLSLMFMVFKNKKVLAWVLVIILTGLSVMTFQRNKVWKNELTLWTDVVSKSPEKGRGHFALGNAYMQTLVKGQTDLETVDKAIHHYEEARRFKLPQFAELHNSLAIAYAFKGDFQTSIKYYQEALQLKPDYPEAARNLKIVQSVAAQSEPEQRKFLENLNYAYGDPAREAKASSPRDAQKQFALGHAAMEKRDFKNAIEHYKQAVRLNPQYAEAHNSLAIAYTFNGELEMALVSYSDALRLRPDYRGARSNMNVIQEVMYKSDEDKKTFVENLKYSVSGK